MSRVTASLFVWMLHPQGGRRILMKNSGGGCAACLSKPLPYFRKCHSPPYFRPEHHQKSCVYYKTYPVPESVQNLTIFQTKMVKSVPNFKPKGVKNHTLWHFHYPPLHSQLEVPLKMWQKTPKIMRCSLFDGHHVESIQEAT